MMHVVMVTVIVISIIVITTIITSVLFQHSHLLIFMRTPHSKITSVRILRTAIAHWLIGC